MPMSSSDPHHSALSALDDASVWLNTEPLTSAGLRGRVALVDFWTYSCINWLRTLPYVRAWHERYHDRGLAVVGVHAPEFGFEHDLGNVRRAIGELGVGYPVVIDNEFAIWRSFDNHYWPAVYLVDGDGRVRFHHFGEEAYAETEREQSAKPAACTSSVASVQWLTSPALELRQITKRFGTLVANNAIEFELRRGEIHALLGENGAGKSTLMNVLYGLHQPDEGEILLGGETVEIHSPRQAMNLGIGMVHQHFMLVPVMTVAENLVLGAEPRNGPLLDYKAAARRTRELSERFGLAVDPDAKVEDLGVGAQQRVEILRALFGGAKVLVLDEPTAVLTAQESQDLFGSCARSRRTARRSCSSPTSSTRCSTSPTA